MRNLYNLIVKNPGKVIWFFGIASVISIVLFLCTGINYNMLDYLPEEANSTIALEKMGEEFEQPIPNLNIMVEDVSIPEALEIKERLSQAEYVSEVLWLDDALDVKQPLEVQDSDTVEMLSSGKSISASMLTTLFGFVALVFMEFRIGTDMGINLVKGVLLSFVCAMVLLPALLLKCGNLIDKTKHRRLFPTFSKLGNAILKVHIPVAVLLVLIILPAYLGQTRNDFFYGTTESTPEGSEGYEIEQKFGMTNTMVLLVPAGDSVKEQELCNDLASLEHVTNILSYASVVTNKIPSDFLGETVTSQFYSEHYARIILTADCPYEGEEAFTLVEKIREIEQQYYPEESYTCGQSPNMYDMRECVQADNKRVNLITIVCIYLVLLGMTKNWFMPVLLILAIQCSIWVNMSVPYFTASKLSYLCYLIVSTVQMGATVDYAILLTDTYQEKRLHAERKEAMRNTLGNVFSSILVSALTLAGFCMAGASSNAILAGMGILIGRGAVLSVVMVMLLLPTFLLASDRIIPYTGIIPGKRKNKGGVRKMNRNKRLLKRICAAGLGTMVLVNAAAPVYAAEVPTEKNENVYATLENDGSVSGVYVVNEFSSDEAGEFSDYGNYTSLKNLTDESEISVESDHITGTMPKGKFYYQGNLESEELP